MTWEEALRCCPESVAPACHNAVDNVTVSGPIDSIKCFVTELQMEGIFARPVSCGGFAFHSSCVLPAAPLLMQRLQQVSSSVFYASQQPSTSISVSKFTLTMQWTDSVFVRTLSCF